MPLFNRYEWVAQYGTHDGAVRAGPQLTLHPHGSFVHVVPHRPSAYDGGELVVFDTLASTRSNYRRAT
jgi:predicted 2-oxoglutarate/Fe(II)-dependent dioxygenase YbiX